MATVIGDAAEAIRRREEAAAAIRAENDASAHEHVRLKGLGPVTAEIPLDAIDTTKLVRDRSSRADLDLDELIVSIRDVGLSNPIRVELRPDGRPELIQGLRRLSAYRALQAEAGGDRWARIPAGIMPTGDDLPALYRRGVDENLIRKDVSFAEMASLARGYAADVRVELDAAVNALFASAAPQKRSYVRRFALLLMRLDKVLTCSGDPPRARPRTRAATRGSDGADPCGCRRAARPAPQHGGGRACNPPPLCGGRGCGPPAPSQPCRSRPARRGKTVLRMPYSAGEVKCTATAGRIELATDRDFSALPPDRLEAATLAFLRALE